MFRHLPFGEKKTHLDAALNFELDNNHASDREGDQQIARILLSIRETAVALNEVLSELLES